MTKEELQKLYKEIILPESKNPYHFKKLANCDLILEANNPFCGDQYRIFVDQQNGVVNQVYFDGFGCAVSKASTSILAKLLEGKKMDEVQSFCSRFMTALSDHKLRDFKEEPLNVLAALMDFDGRIDCIKLSWEVVKEHFENITNGN